MEPNLREVLPGLITDAPFIEEADKAVFLQALPQLADEDLKDLFVQVAQGWEEVDKYVQEARLSGKAEAMKERHLQEITESRAALAQMDDEFNNL